MGAEAIEFEDFSELRARDGDLAQDVHICPDFDWFEHDPTMKCRCVPMRHPPEPFLVLHRLLS